MTQDEAKRAVAAVAIEAVRPGMRLGLGTGSTAKHFVDLLGELVRDGLQVICVPTSEATRAQAQSLNIPLTTLDETPELDLTVDGADELDAHLNLIKGGGAALLREKIVAAASARMIVIADASKKVETLGRFPLPIEVIQFGLGATKIAVAKAIEAAGCTGPTRLRLAADGHPLVTDSGHVILDAALERIPDARALADNLAAVPGVVEHGLFIGLASEALIAGPTGVERLASPA
ncbi:ribose-5-phosphate isomerase A [Agaricicola taiwanensis]|uniref:Ribose-5-phosphate isomerase A n=1 Tax=Agaricicola taiwanensis TaxID=591372 RepID=A0A8J2VSR5_9RHOB|nr:ribose-5-phosphate isomerase RpiA [Agaricicola taiwanensis]GGE37505.1 ribose-5-phosphate isomerase A [Agaricicola taiwanensis]